MKLFKTESYCVDHAGLKLTGDPPVSSSQVLELKAWATTLHRTLKIWLLFHNDTHYQLTLIYIFSFGKKKGASFLNVTKS